MLKNDPITNYLRCHVCGAPAGDDQIGEDEPLCEKHLTEKLRAEKNETRHLPVGKEGR